MIKAAFLVSGCLMSVITMADNLKSRLIPGGFYIGQVKPDNRVLFQKREVRVSSSGRFIIGFGRDEPLQQHYKVIAPNGKVSRYDFELKPREYRVSSLTGIDKKYISPGPEVLARIKREAAQVREARNVDSDIEEFWQGFSWPVKGRISGVYGSQRIYNGKPGRPHYGLDVAVPAETPVKAPASGIVRLAEPELYYSGGTIIIDHGYGLTSSFLHLSDVSVEVGQSVERGDIIGDVGATGRVTGAHLDWRYNWFNKRLDPALLTLD